MTDPLDDYAREPGSVGPLTMTTADDTYTRQLEAVRNAAVAIANRQATSPDMLGDDYVVDHTLMHALIDALSACRAGRPAIRGNPTP